MPFTVGRLLACAAALAWLCAMPAQSQAAGSRGRARAASRPRRHVVSTRSHHDSAPRRGKPPRRARPHRSSGHSQHGHTERSHGGHKHAGQSPSSTHAPSSHTPSPGNASPTGGARAPATSSPGAASPHGRSTGGSHTGAKSPRSPAHGTSPSSGVKPAKAVGHLTGGKARGEQSGGRASQQRPAVGGDRKRAGAKRAGAPGARPRKLPASESSLASDKRAHSTGRSPSNKAKANRDPSGPASAGSLAHSSLPVIIAGIAAALVIALLFLDGLGYGPRHQPRRPLWSRRRLP
jgi:hypothetical protein